MLTRPDGRPTLSVCIVGLDLAHRIGPLLEQASAIADEIVYADGGSSDGSRDLVAQFPRARFLVRPFDDNVARWKNFALDAARGEWALIVDADELLGPKAIALLPAILRSGAKSVKFPRYWLVDPGHFVDAPRIYPDRQLRLFRNRPEMRYDVDSPIHHIFPRDSRRDPCLRLKGAHLLHYVLMWHDRRAREERAVRYAKVHPDATPANYFYLYEDMPHRISRCDECWIDGRAEVRRSPWKSLVDRLRIRTIGRKARPAAAGRPA